MGQYRAASTPPRVATGGDAVTSSFPHTLGVQTVSGNQGERSEGEQKRQILGSGIKANGWMCGGVGGGVAWLSQAETMVRV